MFKHIVKYKQKCDTWTISSVYNPGAFYYNYCICMFVLHAVRNKSAIMNATGTPDCVQA